MRGKIVSLILLLLFVLSLILHMLGQCPYYIARWVPSINIGVVLLLFIVFTTIYLVNNSTIFRHLRNTSGVFSSLVVFALWECVVIIFSVNTITGSLFTLLFVLFPVLTYAISYLYVYNNGANVGFYFATISCFVITSIVYSQVYLYILYNPLSVGGFAVSYYPLFFFFPLLLRKNNILNIILFCLLTIILFTANKRGGVVAAAVGVAVYLYLYFKDKNKKVAILIAALLAIAVYYVLFRLNDYVDLLSFYNRFQNIAEDGGSGRSDIYKGVWQLYTQSDLPHMILGHGYSMVAHDMGNEMSAHSDFLEVLYDYGLVGFVVYVSIFIKIFKLVRKLLKTNKNVAIILASFLSAFLVLSLISNIIIYLLMGVATFVIGALEGFSEYEKNKNTHLPPCY